MNSLIEYIKLFTILILLSGVGYYHFIYAQPSSNSQIIFYPLPQDTVYIERIQKDTVYIKNKVDSSYINKIQVPALLRKDVPILKINK